MIMEIFSWLVFALVVAWGGWGIWGAWKDHKRRESWYLPSDERVIRPPAYRDMRELPSLLRRQAE